MKKVIVGLVIVGAALALRPLVKRRVVQKMREHGEQMAAKCKEMMGQPEARGEGAGPHEHGDKLAEPVDAPT